MKKIALINDLSGFGRCSLTAAIPVISAMGIQACPLPTGVLSAQTGFDSYFCDDYTERMDCFINEWKKMNVSFDGIYSGFLVGPAQIKKVLLFLEQFKSENNLYMLDPVLGDNGEVIKIYNEEFLCEMKKLVRFADVITPNLTELCLLTDTNYKELTLYKKDEDYLERIEQIAKGLINTTNPNLKMVVTGIIRQKDDKEYIGNLVVENSASTYVESAYIKQSFSGTGDLFASVVCGSLIQGNCLDYSVKKAVDFLQTAIEDAAKENVDSRHGVFFERYLSKLIDK